MKCPSVINTILLEGNYKTYSRSISVDETLVWRKNLANLEIEVTVSYLLNMLSFTPECNAQSKLTIHVPGSVCEENAKALSITSRWM